MPKPWSELLEGFSPQQKLAAFCWIILVWGRGKSILTASDDAEQAILALLPSLHKACFADTGIQLNALTQHFDAEHLLRDELALLALVSQQLANNDAAKAVSDLLQLDDTLSQQGKTCLQELMIDTALAYAGASWQVK